MVKHWWSVQGAGREGVSDAWINNLMRANCQNHVGSAQITASEECKATSTPFFSFTKHGPMPNIGKGSFVANLVCMLLKCFASSPISPEGPELSKARGGMETTWGGNIMTVTDSQL